MRSHIKNLRSCLTMRTLEGYIKLSEPSDAFSCFDIMVKHSRAFLIYNINIVKYKPLKGSSYIELPPKLRHPAKGLINHQNNDNERFRWCRIRHSFPQQKDPQRIKKMR